MAISIDQKITARQLTSKLDRLFELSGAKIIQLHKAWNPEHGTPVYTANGVYTTRGWTEWTQGFQFGSPLLQFDATEERRYLEMGRALTIEHMASHVSHTGVHDHGFNNISTYGNLRRLMLEGALGFDERELQVYELALKVSGAVQAARWTTLQDGRGYIYSFNGPHSLFIDTLRSLRSLALAHRLGHCLMGERDQRISLLQRLVDHASVTAEYAIYFGKGRDAYDVRGRTAHESIFNVNDGTYRCPSTQQGYSPFTTWTRGLAWGILGYAEQLEFIRVLPVTDFASAGEQKSIAAMFLEAALATADYYLENTPTCGVPYWDTGAPNLHRLGDYLNKPADPFNEWEPVDSSAAAIAAQGLLRLGNYLGSINQARAGRKYRQAALTIANTLFDEPYLSTKPKHQGLLLHSIYHRPNGWDRVPKGAKVPQGESTLWGDYHARELGLMLQREAEDRDYLTFFGPQ